jgi:hypothetical protein
MLMFGLLAAAIMVAVGFFLRKRAAGQQPQAARAGGMQYAPAGMPGWRSPPSQPSRPRCHLAVAR